MRFDQKEPIRLGELVSINKRSYNPRKNWGFINYLDTGNITENIIDEIKFLEPNIDKIPSRARRIVEENDIIFSTVRPNQRHYGLIEVPLENMLVSTGFAVLTPKESIVDSKYLYYYLTQDNIIKLLHSIAEQSTSAYPSIRPIDLQNLEIVLPCMNIQRQVANTLSCLDKKIELNNKINENLEQQAQAIFKNWFVDFEPFQDGKFVESELGMIPNGWKVARLPEFVEVTYGSAFQSKYFNKEKKGFPLLRIRDLKTRNPQIYTEQELGNQTIIEAGDLVAGMDAEFIPYIWLGEKALMNQRVCRFKYKDKTISNLYTYYLLKPSLEYIQNYKTGTTVSHIGKRDIDNIAIIVPPTSILHDFSNIVKPILNYKIALANQIRTLTNLRDTLLPKLMSGEIEVPVE